MAEDLPDWFHDGVSIPLALRRYPYYNQYAAHAAAVELLISHKTWLEDSLFAMTGSCIHYLYDKHDLNDKPDNKHPKPAAAAILWDNIDDMLLHHPAPLHDQIVMRAAISIAESSRRISLHMIASLGESRPGDVGLITKAMLSAAGLNPHVPADLSSLRMDGED